jgi:ankyrin repeat protein
MLTSKHIRFILVLFCTIILSSDPAGSQETDYSDTLAFNASVLEKQSQDMIHDQTSINESKRWQIEKHLKHLSDDTKKFIFAVACNDFKTADKLFDKADLNAVDNNGNSAILYYTDITLDNLSTRKLSWMIDKGINFDKLLYIGIAMGEPKYETFIEHISWNPSPLLLYLNRFPEKVNLANPKSGQTALGNASSYNRLESVYVLLRFGADPNLPDAHGETPFIQSVIHENYEIAILLVGYGAKTNISFSFRSKKYRNALEFLLYDPYSCRDDEDQTEETPRSILKRQKEPLKQTLINLLIQKQHVRSRSKCLK